MTLSKLAQQPGDLDPTFGQGGRFTDFIPGSVRSHLNSITVQPDGKIVAAGSYGLSACCLSGFALVRYNEDGSPDSSFGIGGKVTTPVANSGLTDVALQQDGKIVAVATAYSQNANTFYIVLARYNPNGSVDASFGSGGLVTYFPVGLHRAGSVAIQSDGKILVAGTKGGAFFVLRYNSNGAPDNSFGIGGSVTTPIEYYSDWDWAEALSVAIQSDGQIVAAGFVAEFFNEEYKGFALARYNSDGSLDTSFSDDGILVTGESDGLGYGGVHSVAIQPDRKIVAAGGNYIGRYSADGSLDTTFAGDGIVISPIGIGYGSNAVVLQPDGKIVAAGVSHNGLPAGNDFSLVRYTPDGSLDNTFGGGGGIATVDFDHSNDRASGMALDSEGRAVVIGDSNGAIALSRLLLDPSRAPFDFDGDGRSDVSVFRSSDSVWYLNRSTDGFTAAQFGLPTDKIVPADYDGDYKTDIAIFRNGTWWRINSGNSTVEVVQFGMAGDIPLPGDYNGDGRDELAVYRNGEWWITGYGRIDFGLATDKPVPADYDGDGKADIAVYRHGTWWRTNSSNGAVQVVQFGVASDKPVVADYDGDSKADIAVYRDGTWYLQQSMAGFIAFQWGLSTDIPAPADYDGDGKADAAVFRDGTWYILRTTGGALIQQFGLAGDKPLASAYVQ